MKFSVLLPTRNRLKYLKYAVESVLNQDYNNWEIIISDNHSDEDIFGYVESLKDDRVKYFRTSTFVSVTENWNNVMNRFTGDYVIMLGDDDILLNGYFSTMIDLLSKYDHPELIYANAYIYSYPGVIHGMPDGHLLSCKHYPVFKESKEPFWMTKEDAMRLVQGHLNFDALFGTNMQFILINKALIEKHKVNHQFFHSPYPDVYAMCMLILEASRILVFPKELVVIGVTPKSTGNFLVNDDEKKGMEFLNISKELNSMQSLSKILLPGSFSITSWLISIETVKERFKDKINLKVNYKRYRLLQIEQSIKSFYSKKKNTTGAQLRKLFFIIQFHEKLFFFIPLLILHSVKKLCPKFIKHFLVSKYNAIFALSSIPGDGTIYEKFQNIFQVFERHDKHKLFSAAEIEQLLEECIKGTSDEELCKKYDCSKESLKNWKQTTAGKYLRLAEALNRPF